jgi:hypothetical protein
MMSQEARSGTLMWVGPRDTAELRPIFEFCEENVSQIAVRRDLTDARRRSADNVRCIVLARHDRSRIDYAVLEKLSAQHPYADTVELIGPLCAGQTPLPTAGIARIDWHRWNQSIPGLLFSCGVTESNCLAQADSVAVVAATMSDADPLMDLAAGLGAATVWCRRPGAMLARNFGAVWWDDSVATPASETEWRRRIESVNRNAVVGVEQTNVWMTNHPQANQIAAAERAGVDVVLSKPLKIDSLLATIGVHDRPALAATVRHNRPRAA